MYKFYRKSKISQARLGTLTTKHGKISTPFFMPIATKATVKALTIEEIKKLKSQILLSNTYHLYLRPGIGLLKQAKGLHKFMDWQGPILTDSGGYQVFSLAGTKNRSNKSLVKIKPNGVEFSSHLDGSKHIFTPKKVLEIQNIIGSDIMMILDVCTKNPATKVQASKDLELTHKWARMAKQEIKKCKYKNQLCFAIIQGSTYKDLRLESARGLVDLDFDGYAIGGLAVGETHQEMYQVLDYTVPELPTGKPRYLMGVGRPENIIEAVKKGIDMFDCVIPTREARHGRLYIFEKNDISRKNFYQTMNILNRKYANDFSPINKQSSFAELRNYSRSYLHHLFRVHEPLSIRLATLQNLEFYLQLMQSIRNNIRLGKL